MACPRTTGRKKAPAYSEARGFSEDDVAGS